MSGSSAQGWPDFLIIGAQKAGTSSLYHFLGQHPDLLPSRTKEVHFFDGGLNSNEDNFSKGPAWYLPHFPPKRNDRQKTFEASPLYLFNPLAPARIAGLIPDVKLIAILRDPAERAISHYFHEKRKGREPLPVMQALLAEEDRLRPCIDRQDYKNEIFIHHSYKSRGLYHAQLKRYLGHFPKNNILVINSEALFAEEEKTLRQVFEFVGVDAEFRVNDLDPRNVGSNKTGIDPAVHEYLHDYFRSPNQALYELTGQDFGWDTQPRQPQLAEENRDAALDIQIPGAGKGLLKRGRRLY